MEMGRDLASWSETGPFSNVMALQVIKLVRRGGLIW